MRQDAPDPLTVHHGLPRGVALSEPSPTAATNPSRVPPVLSSPVRAWVTYLTIHMQLEPPVSRKGIRQRAHLNRIGLIWSCSLSTPQHFLQESAPSAMQRSEWERRSNCSHLRRLPRFTYGRTTNG